MNYYENRRRTRSRGKLNIFITAAVFIALGTLLILRNLGYIEPAVFKIIVSWQMLLIVLGVSSLLKKGLTSGLILTGTGIFFMLPRIFGQSGHIFSTYWPAVFVIIGVIILIHMLLPRRLPHAKGGRGVRKHAPVESFNNDNGFLTSDNNFGSVHHIVLDEVFLGAEIRTNFGGTVIDLRHTSIAPGDTYIEITGSFSGVEIYVPYNWIVVTDIDLTLSGMEDKRHETPVPVKKDRRLIIKGRLSFSGVEIKN